MGRRAKASGSAYGRLPDDGIRVMEQYRRLVSHRDERPSAKRKDKLAETKKQNAEVRTAVRNVMQLEKDKKKLERTYSGNKKNFKNETRVRY